MYSLVSFHSNCSINFCRNPTESVVISNYDHGSTKKKNNIISRNSADGVTILSVRDPNDYLTADGDEKCKVYQEF